MFQIHRSFKRASITFEQLKEWTTFYFIFFFKIYAKHDAQSERYDLNL